VLNQANGNTLWQANLSGDSLAKPVINGQHLFIKTIDGNLYSFDLKKGEQLWVVDHGSPHLILKASSAPVLFDKLVLVGFSDGKLDAVDSKTGRLVWQRNIAFATGGSDVERLVDIDADPIVRGEQVYLASYQGYIGALSLQNGEFIWQQPASIYKNIAMSGDTLYYVDSESTVWARNRNNGHVKWKQEAFKARGLTEPVLMGNRLLIGDKSGYLHGLDVSTGELVSRTFVNAPLLSAPVVSGASIYVLAANGKLSRFSKV
jgi:outer membrane protein assembly factor BamB